MRVLGLLLAGLVACDGGMGDEAACGDGVCQERCETCRADCGACGVAPASRWEVHLVRLDVPAQTYDGAAWDAFGGAPDLYVQTVAGASAPVRTGTAADTFAAEFSGSAVEARADELEQYLEFRVWDEDVADDDLVGACTVRVDAAVFEGATQTARCARDPGARTAGYTLTWRLRQR